MFDFITQHELPTVLLIDDDMVSREVMATILTMSGYSVHTADGGEQAIQLLAAKAFEPTVILMDVQMPGLSGIALVEQLRASSGARLYVISASNPSDQVRNSADGFLLKPFQPEALTKLIDDHHTLNRPAAVRGLDLTEIIINPETLAQLREMMPEVAVRQIYEAIIADVNKRTLLLEAAITNADWTETRRIGHAIKGGGSMAGALQIARLGELVESGGLVNQSDNKPDIIHDLRAAAANLERMLNAEIKLQVSQDTGG
jgi:CheY-like chemotaxis protein